MSRRPTGSSAYPHHADGNLPGTVSLIDSTTCHGTVTIGYGKRFPVMATGQSPVLAALDAMFVADLSNAAVTVLNLTHCNAAVTSGLG